jgi:hypothetical protein
MPYGNQLTVELEKAHFTEDYTPVYAALHGDALRRRKVYFTVIFED